MIKNGTYPNRVDHRDLDYIKSKHPRIYAGVESLPNFPSEYLCDAGKTMPNQEILDSSFTPPVAPMPNGCTNETQADICTDLSNGTTIYRPDAVEAVTHANALGGIDIRTSLLALVNSLKWIKNFFNIRATGLIDFFDAFRLAIVSGDPEKRSVSWGTPWFASWEAAAQGNTFSVNADGSFRIGAGGTKQFVMPMPSPQELTMIAKNPNAFPWHNSKLDGWVLVNGSPVLRDKSWQGTGVGQNGFIAFDRATINVVMGISGAVGYTGTMEGTATPQTIDVTIVQWIVSLVLNLFNKTAGRFGSTIKL
jgi:hypothetical protein